MPGLKGVPRCPCQRDKHTSSDVFNLYYVANALQIESDTPGKKGMQVKKEDTDAADLFLQQKSFDRPRGDRIAARFSKATSPKLANLSTRKPKRKPERGEPEKGHKKRKENDESDDEPVIIHNKTLLKDKMKELEAALAKAINIGGGENQIQELKFQLGEAKSELAIAKQQHDQQKEKKKKKKDKHKEKKQKKKKKDKKAKKERGQESKKQQHQIAKLQQEKDNLMLMQLNQARLRETQQNQMLMTVMHMGTYQSKLYF
jgi:hypothetical protein